jgi:hypothetical protein
VITHIGGTVDGGPSMRWKLPGGLLLKVLGSAVRAFGDPGKREPLRTRVDENPEHPGDHHPDDEADQPPANPPQRVPRIPVRALRRNTHVVVAHASEATNAHRSRASYGAR